MARGYIEYEDGGFCICYMWFYQQVENDDQGGMIFQAKPKVAYPGMRLPGSYGDTRNQATWKAAMLKMYTSLTGQQKIFFWQCRSFDEANRR